MRYEAWAYGTREEIEAELLNALSGKRSERRTAEIEKALAALRDGSTSVYSGKIHYIVEEPSSE